MSYLFYFDFADIYNCAFLKSNFDAHFSAPKSNTDNGFKIRTEKYCATAKLTRNFREMLVSKTISVLGLHCRETNWIQFKIDGIGQTNTRTHSIPHSHPICDARVFWPQYLPSPFFVYVRHHIMDCGPPLNDAPCVGTPIFHNASNFLSQHEMWAVTALLPSERPRY